MAEEDERLDALSNVFQSEQLQMLFSHIRHIGDRHRDVEAIHEILEKIAPKLFSNLTRRSVMQICRHFTIKIFERDDVICLQGDESDGYYFILHGAASVYVASDAEAVQAIDRSLPFDEFCDTLGARLVTLEANTGFGEVSFLTASGKASRRTASIISDGEGFVEPPTGQHLCCVFVSAELFELELQRAFNQKLNLMQKVAPLQKFILLQSLSDTELVRVAYAMYAKSLVKNSIVAKEGSRCSFCYFILSGNLRIYQTVTGKQTDVDGNEYLTRVVIDIAKLGPGDIFGVRELMERRSNFMRSAIACQNVTMMAISNSAIEKLVLTNARCLQMLERIYQHRSRWDSFRGEFHRKFPHLNNTNIDASMMKIAKYAFTRENCMDEREVHILARRKAASIKNYRRTLELIHTARHRFHHAVGPRTELKQRTLEILHDAKLEVVRGAEDAKESNYGADVAKMWASLHKELQDARDEVQPTRRKRHAAKRSKIRSASVDAHAVRRASTPDKRSGVTSPDGSEDDADDADDAAPATAAAPIENRRASTTILINARREQISKKNLFGEDDAEPADAGGAANHTFGALRKALGAVDGGQGGGEGDASGDTSRTPKSSRPASRRSRREKGRSPRPTLSRGPSFNPDSRRGSHGSVAPRANDGFGDEADAMVALLHRHELATAKERTRNSIGRLPSRGPRDSPRGTSRGSHSVAPAVRGRRPSALMREATSFRAAAVPEAPEETTRDASTVQALSPSLSLGP